MLNVIYTLVSVPLARAWEKKKKKWKEGFALGRSEADLIRRLLGPISLLCNRLAEMCVNCVCMCVCVCGGGGKLAENKQGIQ